jgi:hypothetical protein
MSKDLGPKPDAQIEPGEPNPGGVDAVDADQGTAEPAIPDLPTDKNPAVGDETPDEVTSGEDTSTRATESSGEENDIPGEDEDQGETPA